jgi:hypothetical protein
MKAYELPVKVTSEGKLDLTSVVLEELSPGQQVRVIILVEEATSIPETPSTAYIQTDEADHKLLPEIANRGQQLELLKRVTEHMQQNPLPAEALPLTREALHERP